MSSREPRVLQLGFMPLIDSAPLIAAARLGLDRKQGLRFQLQRQASWAAIRDKLLSGELDAVHALSGLVHGVQFGIGGLQADMAVLLTLNHNGQSITVSSALAREIRAGKSLANAFASLPRRPVFAQTFPTGTHAMWLSYWLASHGVQPLSDIQNIVMPPPRMADALAAGELDGYCSGEPWGLQSEALGTGQRIIRSGEIWADHPEKVLACRRDFAELEPETTIALTAALLAACRWLDDPAHRREAVNWLADADVIGLPAERIEQCLLPAEPSELAAPPLRFHANGAVNMPYLSDGLWFASQFHRWGLLTPDVTEQRCEDTIAGVHRIEQYRQAAAHVGVEIPANDRRVSTLCDGMTWTGRDAIAYAESFPLRAPSLRA